MSTEQTEQTEQKCVHGYIHCRECLNDLEQEAALEKFLAITYRYSRSTCEDEWSGIVFEPSAVAKLCTIAGWLTALSQTEHRLLALELAKDLDSSLQYLCEYGGYIEVGKGGDPYWVGSDEWKQATDVKAFRVQLHDDGTFGGFGVCWYTYVSPRRFREMEDGSCIVDELTTERYFVLKKGETSRVPLRSITQRYRYSMNGALLYRGPGGGEVFSVSLDNHQGWSLHT